MTEITSEWIQNGEVGALFVAILIIAFIVNRIIVHSSQEKKVLASIITDVMIESENRESKLMEFVLSIQPSFEIMLESQKSMERRITEIERNLNRHISSSELRDKRD